MRVLVATDLSEGSDHAIREAHAIAGTGGVLGACHVLGYPMFPAPPYYAASAMIDPETVPRASETLTQRITALTGRAPGAFEIFVEQGSAYAEIARRAEAWRADLVVVGTHGHGGVARVLGTIAERVVRVAPCPVLVAREAKGAGCVLAATDLSDPSLPALDAGWREAQRGAAPFVAMHVVDLGPMISLQSIAVPFGGSAVAPSNEVLEEVVRGAKTVLQSAMARIGATGEVLVVAGSAPAAIVSQAEQRGARLVVVATRGRTGLARLALGSVAERVVRFAPCSVLVTRREGA